MKRIFFILCLCISSAIWADNSNSFSNEKEFSMQKRESSINQVLSKSLKKTVHFDWENAKLFIEDVDCNDYQEILDFLKVAAMALDKKAELDQANKAMWKHYMKELKYAGKIAIRDSLACPFLEMKTENQGKLGFPQVL